MSKKRMTAAVLVLVLVAALFGGCGKSVATEKYATTAVATFGEEKIYLDEANFMARYSQYNYEVYYLSLFGEDFWGYDLMGDGSTMEDVVKEDSMAQLYQTKYLCSMAEGLKVSLSEEDEAKIAESVKEFFEDMPEEMIEASLATEELVTKVFTENALANLVWEALVADVKTDDLKLEDYARKDIEFLLVSLDSSDKENTLTDEDIKKVAEEIQEKVEDGKKVADIKKDYEKAEGYKVTSTTTTIAEKTYDNDLGKTAWKMKTDDIEMVQVKETGYYVVKMVDDNNEEAAQNAMDQAIDTRKANLFQEKYTDLLEDAPEFKVDESVWAVVKFEDAVYVAPEETEKETEGETEKETAASK